MGIFYVDCTVINPRTPDESVTIDKMMVDTGAEYSWIPMDKLKNASIDIKKKNVPFLMANGKKIKRDIGYAIIKADGFETVDEVVFAQPGDLKLLGSRTLEGFAAVIDSRKKKLVAAGPIPVA